MVVPQMTTAPLAARHIGGDWAVAGKAQLVRASRKAAKARRKGVVIFLPFRGWRGGKPRGGEEIKYQGAPREAAWETVRCV